MNRRLEVIATLLAIAALLSFPVIGTYVQCHAEAASFNRLTTGPKVTAWDALWLDLRVEAK